MQTVSRLINYFVPEHYQLSVDLRRSERTFSGVVTLNGTTQEGANKIVVHAKDLTIESLTFDGKEAEFSFGENDEVTIIHPDIHPGRHIVIFAFSGTITDAMHGLYPCYYTHNGEKKELLATQFESHHAREVFPCIDEPEAKATFDVTLTTEQNIHVLGNMPVAKQNTEDNRLVTTFATTPRMSTYLLAWVTGDLHKKTALTKRGVEVNIWATPAQRPESLDFALDIATRTIDFFEEYFDTPYPLPKSDHVALPDFSAGAMENWGLVTYREIALLADPATVSVSSKHYIATVIAHELSHQWFGNLVTMKWWNSLWLNESFATLMEYIAVDALHPEWNIWLDFATNESIVALRRDSLAGVQPVQVDVNHPDEISTLFDGAIVYAKGARLLRMLQQYVGHTAFQIGLKAYFAAHKYSNTEGSDLWQALSAASGKDIASFMETWISQSGYPVIHVKQDEDNLTLSQQQFFVGPHEPSRQIWPIPLNASDKALPELLSTQTASITRPTDTSLRLNVGDSAHFITHYDEKLLVQLINDVHNNKLSPVDRVQLLHENILLARGGVISSAQLIPLLDAYKQESAESVWDMINLAIGELKKFVEGDEPSEAKLRTLAANLAREQYTRLGWAPKENEPEEDTKLRATIISMMIYAQDAETLKTAKELYETKPLEELDPELRALILGATVRYSSEPAIVDSLLESYKTTSSAELQQDIASGLTATRDKERIKQLLALIKEDSVIRHQDVTRWFVWLLRNRDGRDLTWQWLQESWPWIEKTFGSDKSYDDYPRYSAAILTTRRQLNEYREFFTPMQNEPALARVISIGLRDIEGRVELIERDQVAVRRSLSQL